MNGQPPTQGSPRDSPLPDWLKSILEWLKPIKEFWKLVVFVVTPIPVFVPYVYQTVLDNLPLPSELRTRGVVFAFLTWALLLVAMILPRSPLRRFPFWSAVVGAVLFVLLGVAFDLVERWWKKAPEDYFDFIYWHVEPLVWGLAVAVFFATLSLIVVSAIRGIAQMVCSNGEGLVKRNRGDRGEASS